jgi:outer membrane protein assembly factor BamB
MTSTHPKALDRPIAAREDARRPSPSQPLGTHNGGRASPRAGLAIRSGFALLVSLCLAATSPGAAASTSQVLKQNGVKGGLVVVVGCDDPELLVELGRRDGYLVQGLDTDRDRVNAAVDAIRAAGLYGKVSATLFDGTALPYVDNLVNAVVVRNVGDPEPGRRAGYEIRDEEIKRVLAPRGILIANPKSEIRNPKWKKPVPTGVDDWSHHLYDATGIGTSRDTVVAQPRSMQWKAGPEYSRSHENMSSVSAVVSAAGRVFSIMDEGPTISLYLPSKWFLSARDAFSGVLLWKVPIAEWHAELFPLKSGPQQLPRRLVATEDRVYVTLGIDAPVSELDAATGKILRTFDETVHAEEVLHANGKLLVVAHDGSGVVAYGGKTPKSRPGFALAQKAWRPVEKRVVMLVDAGSGKTVWKTDPEPVASMTLAAAGDRAHYVCGNAVVGVGMKDGKKLWSKQVAAKPVRSSTAVNPALVVHDGIVYTATGGKLTARDAGTGEEMWSATCAKAGYRAPTTLHIVNGLVWDVDAGGEPYRPGSDLKKINRWYVGYDLCTGEEKKRIPVSADHGYAIMHHRCHIPRAAGSNIITSFPGIEFFDLKTGKVTHDSWIRGACLYGFMPANGLLYTPPHPCACYTQGKLSGFWAVAGRRGEGPGARLHQGYGGQASSRLERGLVHASLPNPQSAIRNPKSPDWPTYRGGAARSGVTKATVPVKVKEMWSADVGAGLSQCVVAGGRVFVSTVDSHQVHALDADTGKALWTYTAGGRVDSAPTYYRGTVLFGSRDGYVTCLAADKGELVWRFRASPVDRRAVVYDQIESVWPVHGSVLVHDGVLWFCAGRSSYLDGGLHVHRLNPLTGEVLTTTRIDSLGPRDEQKPIESTMRMRLDMEGAKNDVLSCDGSNIFMRHWAFDLEGKSVERNLDHLFSPTGFLDTTWFRRTYWIYGQIYVSGAQGWARTGNARPSGRILSIDGDTIYGFGRDKYPPSPGNAHQMYLQGEKEFLFATSRTKTVATVAEPVRGKRQRRKAALGSSLNALWSVPGDLQVRGMLVAGEGEKKRLFVAGAKGDWVISQDAYEGKEGCVLRVIDVRDGSTIAEQPLPHLPVFDGLSAAGGRLFISLTDGRVFCLGG